VEVGEEGGAEAGDVGFGGPVGHGADVGVN